MSPTTIANVRVFDGTAVSAPRTVTTEGGLISGSQPQPGADVVDGAGGVLLPGLIDGHLHVKSRSELAQCANAGVTTVLDMGTQDLHGLDSLRDLPALPSVLRAGMPASAPGSGQIKNMGYASSSGVSDVRDAERFVGDRVSDGVDYIKIIVEDPRMPNRVALPEATIAAVVDAAHQAGLVVVAHALTSVALRRADDAGVDVITHAPMDRDLTPPEAEALAARGAVLAPTLVMMKGLTRALGEQRAVRVTQSMQVGPGAEFAHSIGSVVAAHTAGVRILVGTDANTETAVPWHPMYGSSVHDELALLVDAGLSPVEAIRAATTTPAEVFGLRDRGAIETGKRADLLLVSGDPTVGIAAVREIRAVWIGGERVG